MKTGIAVIAVLALAACASTPKQTIEMVSPWGPIEKSNERLKDKEIVTRIAVDIRQCELEAKEKVILSGSPIAGDPALTNEVYRLCLERRGWHRVVKASPTNK